MATIPLGIPGPGGDICYSADSVWTSVFGVPLSRIDVKTNKLLRQWVGQGGDSLRLWAGFTLADGFSITDWFGVSRKKRRRAWFNEFGLGLN